VEFCMRACQQCVDRDSFREAVAHFETGLEKLQDEAAARPEDVRRS
jgi:hypothetical protein